MYIYIYIRIYMYIRIYIYIIPMGYIEYARFQPYGCGQKKKILRIFGVEIFGVEFWSA